jgi:hypothetical protein
MPDRGRDAPGDRRGLDLSGTSGGGSLGTVLHGGAGVVLRFGLPPAPERAEFFYSIKKEGTPGDFMAGRARDANAGDPDRGLWASHDAPRLELGTVRMGLCAGMVPGDRPRETAGISDFRSNCRTLLAKGPVDVTPQTVALLPRMSSLTPFSAYDKIRKTFKT